MGCRQCGRQASPRSGRKRSNRVNYKSVAAALSGASISINAAAPPDARSYVGFSLFRQLAPNHQPEFGLPDSLRSVLDGLAAIGFADRNFRKSSRMMRLNRLSAMIEPGVLGSDLRWRPGAAAS